MQANSHDGTLAVSVSIDRSHPSERPDAGSKPWLLSNALEGGGGGRQGVGSAKAGGARSTGGQGGEKLNGDVDGGGDSLPEERFHLKLPAGTPPSMVDFRAVNMEFFLVLVARRARMYHPRLHHNPRHLLVFRSTYTTFETLIEAGGGVV